MLELVFSLFLWLEGATSYQIPPDPPKIVFVSNAELQRITGKATGSPAEIAAAFNMETGILYLKEDFDRGSEYDQSFLLHELVHYLQWYNKERYRCVEQLELPAYRLQTKWLNERRVAHADVSWLIAMMEGCPEDYKY